MSIWGLLAGCFAPQVGGWTDLGKVVAEIGFLLDQSDQTVLDLQKNGGASLDVLGQGAVSGDGELFTPTRREYSAVKYLWSFMTYGRGGLGSRSTWSICRM